ncbi:phosphotransferase [Alicyclobacillus fastidiosus]|uniref:phosphotransferase n=1 Tax=Alicyclobacillus fastidiosus TaxID=392011 RepID=UPI0023E930EC|nr:phosphotransferase [Alicyclobacillus fastidiosus]GMA63003.1 hypothetical protein GCM10025859_34430 [Alicyclobacillus fastidiosus]
MSNVKPNLGMESTSAFLESYFGTKVTELQLITKGETSQAYTFRHQDDDYVIRFNHFEDGFLRDSYAFETLTAYGIPVPRIIDINEFNNMFFAISERVHGNTLDAYKPDQIEFVIPSLVDVLMKLRSANVDSTRGYGPIGHSGDGLYQSWTEHLEAFFAKSNLAFGTGGQSCLKTLF